MEENDLQMYALEHPEAFVNMVFGMDNVLDWYDFSGNFNEGEVIVASANGKQIERLRQHFTVKEIVATSGEAHDRDYAVEIIMRR